jgi:lipopolysaccharide biosynthesis protein
MSSEVQVVSDKPTKAGETINTRARAIAFYLPQFHPIHENDAWWGRGFTEWTNVTKAKPQFAGHYQPHLPSDLGFYDLRLHESRQDQADLARAFGIEGFCYWHYWFEGKRLLERPFNDVLSAREPKFPFCLAWANETWSRRWLGEPKDVLIAQTYSDEDDLKHIRWLMKAFADDRYLTISGKPMFLIYRPSDLPNPQRTTDLFRRECLRNGVIEPYLIGINGHDVYLDARKIGFDATLHFTPQLGVLPDAFEDGPLVSKYERNSRFGVVSDVLKIYDYKDSLEKMLSLRKSLKHPTIPSIFVGWDNTPRRGEKAIIMTNADPEYYQRELSSLIDEQNTKPFAERLVFVNAWNEWAEGNHLEPDAMHGRRYLEATRSALRHQADVTQNRD